MVEDDGIVVRIIAGSYGDKSSTGESFFSIILFVFSHCSDFRFILPQFFLAHLIVDMKTPIRYYDVLIKEEGKVFENALEPEFSGELYPYYSNSLSYSLGNSS